MHRILTAFNSGQMDALTAAERLAISPAQLYKLRHQWLSHGQCWQPRPSGGARQTAWPAEAVAFLADFLPCCRPLNYALLADELHRRLGFHRSRGAVAAFVRTHFANLIKPQRSGPKPRRRWQCAAIGELFQHDSSPHAWWPAADLQCLILTLDDHSRKAMGGVFVRADTTWDHFCLLRAVFERHGLPAAMYTDGLSLFGHTSTADRLDTHSQFQRALTALGVAHRVAPDAPAKGKIERRFGFLQKRLVSVFAFEKVGSHQQANAVLAEQIDYYNQHAICRTTGLTPNQAWKLAQQQSRCHLQGCPNPALLDLHLALYLGRRLNADHTIDFLGQNYPVAATTAKTVTVVHHPQRQFWVIPQPPAPDRPVWPAILAHHRL